MISSLVSSAEVACQAANALASHRYDMHFSFTVDQDWFYEWYSLWLLKFEHFFAKYCEGFHFKFSTLHIHSSFWIMSSLIATYSATKLSLMKAFFHILVQGHSSKKRESWKGNRKKTCTSLWALCLICWMYSNNLITYLFFRKM